MTDISGLTQTIAEVKAALEVDESVLGYVFRADREGKTEAEMADEQGTKRTTWVWSYRRQLKTLLEGDIPQAPTVARQSASMLRGFIRRHADLLSESTQAELERYAKACASRSVNPELQEEEDRHKDEKSRVAENLGVSGIYVYTLPHYQN